MARTVESEKCDAFVGMGNARSYAILPCSRLGKGRCLRDRRIENEFEKVAVVRGTCKADADIGIPAESEAPDFVRDVRDKGGFGANLALDMFLDED